jgi:transcriptional regulator with XRE-family HTH domain
MNILRLKEVLNDKGVTGKDLANKLGVSQNTISNIVNGRNFPKPTLLVDMAKELDVDIKEMFISTKENGPSDPINVLKEIKRMAEKALEESNK